MKYVDGFVLPIPKKSLAAYRRLATQAAKVWLKCGALEYRECVGDDLGCKDMVPFPKAAQAKPTEIVIFAWIVFKSKAHRDRVNAKVMKDPLMTSMDPSKVPFDCQRMVYGGFKTIVDKVA